SKVSRFARLKPNVSLVCRWAADPTSSDRRIPPAFAYTCPFRRTEPPSGGNGTSSNSPNHAGIATSRTARDLAKAVHHIRVIVVRHAVVKGDGQGIAIAVAGAGHIVRLQGKAIAVVAEHMHRVCTRPRRYPAIVQAGHQCVARKRCDLRIDIGDVSLPSMFS